MGRLGIAHVQPCASVKGMRLPEHPSAVPPVHAQSAQRPLVMTEMQVMTEMHMCVGLPPRTAQSCMLWELDARDVLGLCQQWQAAYQHLLHSAREQHFSRIARCRGPWPASLVTDLQVRGAVRAPGHHLRLTGGAWPRGCIAPCMQVWAGKRRVWWPRCRWRRRCASGGDVAACAGPVPS